MTGVSYPFKWKLFFFHEDGTVDVAPKGMQNSLLTSAVLEAFLHSSAFRHYLKLFTLVLSHLWYNSEIFPNIANTHIHTERKLQNQNDIVLLNKFHKNLVAGVSNRACGFVSTVLSSIIPSLTAHERVYKISQ